MILQAWVLRVRIRNVSLFGFDLGNRVLGQPAEILACEALRVSLLQRGRFYRAERSTHSTSGP